MFRFRVIDSSSYELKDSVSCLKGKSDIGLFAVNTIPIPREDIPYGIIELKKKLDPKNPDVNALKQVLLECIMFSCYYDRAIPAVLTDGETFILVKIDLWKTEEMFKRNDKRIFIHRLLLEGTTSSILTHFLQNTYFYLLWIV
eukprot:TRINITY_DN678_c1_g1_i3.p2 TRINITY_DN678_c1_g1~~TRINITY_DN678_c1_g1_i3.p2  ORF type:complete len:143 (-),score=34.01 TRINITY_DN678_c1_g1_i3:344-772(-)